MKQRRSSKPDHPGAPTPGCDGGSSSDLVQSVGESDAVSFKDCSPIKGPDDVRTRSGLEQEVLEDLLMKDAHFTYESAQIRWVSSHVYTPDFLLRTRSRKTIYVEVKGFFRPSERGMFLILKRSPEHAHLDLRFVFDSSKKRLSKNSRTTYGQWCDRHGFKYADHKIPKEWLDE